MGLLLVKLVLKPVAAGHDSAGNFIAYIGFAPLLVSGVLRWLVFPGKHEAGKALVIFIVGLSMAEGCAILGLVLGGELREELFVLGTLGVLQWIPLFAGRFDRAAGDKAHGLRTP
jgi:hypothetical protein